MIKTRLLLVFLILSIVFTPVSALRIDNVSIYVMSDGNALIEADMSTGVIEKTYLALRSDDVKKLLENEISKDFKKGEVLQLSTSKLKMIVYGFAKLDGNFIKTRELRWGEMAKMIKDDTPKIAFISVEVDKFIPSVEVLFPDGEKYTFSYVSTIPSIEHYLSETYIQDVFKKRMKLYSTYASTFDPYYWIKKGNNNLEKFRNEFKNGFIDPLKIVIDISGEISGSGGYQSALTAMEELITVYNTIGCWAIGYKENIAIQKMYEKGYDTYPSDILLSIKNEIENGNINDAKRDIVMAINYLEEMKSEIENNPVESHKLSKIVTYYISKDIQEEKGERVTFVIPLGIDYYYEIASGKAPFGYFGGKYRIKLTLMDGDMIIKTITVEGNHYIIATNGALGSGIVQDTSMSKLFEYDPYEDNLNSNPKYNARMKIEIEILEPNKLMGFLPVTPTSKFYIKWETLILRQDQSSSKNNIIESIIRIGEEKVNKAAIAHIDSTINFLKGELAILSEK